jgi:hypothetical protein
LSASARNVTVPCPRCDVSMTSTFSTDTTASLFDPGLITVTTDQDSCQNIAGNWSGMVSDGFDSLPITLSLSQVECTVTGTITSPASCPGRCGSFTGVKAITGTVSGTTFLLTISNDPWDCDTCQLICYGTDTGALATAAGQMQGNVETEDCETGGSDPVSVNLTRSGFSAASSPSTVQRTTTVNKSSLLHRAHQ